MTGRDLAVVAEVATEFEAETIAAVLREAGIEAVVSRNAPSWTGQMSISPTARGASVLVHDGDLDEARRILKRNVEDSVDLDWDEVDVGERDDDLPLRPPGRMPPLARIALAVAATLLVLGILGALLTTLR